MGDDYLAHWVRIDDPNIKDKGNKVVVQDDGLKVEVGDHDNPGDKTRR